ncbi:helix-turn-helix domain-containing protein [Polynucleobacter sinensis]|uniref:helix-turn-helix domain-containing protein n=1 Tax=Polynucleobacter sinensis TaxID=1743157 RepID=UPI00078324CB|nr:LuxR C-terminal-related transcriptional regulator [Polynucleobacter sinensis]
MLHSIKVCARDDLFQLREALNANPKKQSQSLTARQLQVIGLVGQGLSNKEIANELKISEGTVKQHIFAIFRLLNVSSRAKLAIASQRLSPESKVKPKRVAAGAQSSFGYSWRLIVAVAISVPELAMAEAVKVIERKNYLDQLRFAVDEMVFALDANSMLLPDGGLLIWFGHPTSHIDDVDRAALLVQSIRSRIEADGVEEFHIGLGISTQAEIVPAQTKVLTAASAFQQALSLARKSSQLTLSLANGLTERLCSASVPWLELRPTARLTSDSIQLRRSDDINLSDHGRAGNKENIYAIGNRASTPIKQSQWGDLSFLKEVFQSVSGGVSQWLCVESWPPSLANSLLDAIAVDATKAGFFPLKLHIPSAKRRDIILGSLLTQVEIAATQYDLSSSKPDSTLDRFLSSLWKISTKAPVVLQVVGIQSLQALKSALGDRGIDRLVGLRVLVLVTDLRDIQKQQTSIRILGPRPDNAVFTRIHTMAEPPLDLLPEGVLVDMQAMVDDLSPAARQVIFAAAQTPEKAFNELLPLVNLPRPVLQGALQELVSVGLILPRDDHYFDFRDALTASAIAQLNKQVVST